MSYGVRKWKEILSQCQKAKAGCVNGARQGWCCGIARTIAVHAEGISTWCQLMFWLRHLQSSSLLMICENQHKTAHMPGPCYTRLGTQMKLWALACPWFLQPSGDHR